MEFSLRKRAAGVAKHKASMGRPGAHKGHVRLLLGEVTHLEVPYNVGHLSSVFLVVKPGKIRFLLQKTIPQKEDRILLFIGYHNIPK